MRKGGTEIMREDGHMGALQEETYPMITVIREAEG